MKKKFTKRCNSQTWTFLSQLFELLSLCSPFAAARLSDLSPQLVGMYTSCLIPLNGNLLPVSGRDKNNISATLKGVVGVCTLSQFSFEKKNLALPDFWPWAFLFRTYLFRKLLQHSAHRHLFLVFQNLWFIFKGISLHSQLYNLRCCKRARALIAWLVRYQELSLLPFSEL